MRSKTPRSWLRSFAAAGVLASAAAQELVVSFDIDPFGLPAFWSQARLLFANNYREDGMLFQDGVVPPDPRLDNPRWGDFLLQYEDPSIVFRAFPDPQTGELVLTPGRLVNGDFVPLPVPREEPRALTTHGVPAVVQLTYDPEQDGVPNPFNLKRLEVHDGKLNVGVKFADGSISRMKINGWQIRSGAGSARSAHPTQGGNNKCEFDTFCGSWLCFPWPSRLAVPTPPIWCWAPAAGSRSS